MPDWLQKVAVIVAVAGPISGLVASASILHYRVGVLESETLKALHADIDDNAARISRQWQVIAEIREEVIRLKTRDENR